MAKDKLNYAGDVNLDDVTIISSSGFSQNVTNQVIGVQIFEDLLSPFITGTLLIRESIDLANLFPFVGQELLKLKISTPGLKDGNIDGRFYVYKMSDRVMLGDKQVGYQLHFTSVDAIADLNNPISKGFNGLVSDIAKTILTDAKYGLSTSAKCYIEETKNKHKYVSNYWSPVKNLIYLCEFAVNEKESPTYVFFENRAGYNFCSLDSLYNQAKLLQTFSFDNYTRDSKPQGQDAKNPEEDYKRILELHIPEGIDYIDRLQSGMYGSKLWSFDMSTGEVEINEFDMMKKWSDRNHLNKFAPARSSAIGKFETTILNRPKAFGTFQDYDDVSNTKIIQERISLMKQAESIKIELTVPGRCDYTVGRIVEVNLNKVAPVKKTDPEDKIKDKMFSGKYMVAAINHFITRDKHECKLELIKDSMIFDLEKGTTK
jgi:hypothetical protein